MRTALALPVGLALALIPGRASADMERVVLRLSYVRGAGGETCPAEPTTFRAQVAARMGYDPFEEASAPERLTVVMMAKGRGFAAHVERVNAAGKITWSETFPASGLRVDCEGLMSPLASYVRGMLLTYKVGPAAPPAAPPPEPAAPVACPPSAPPPELRAPPVQSAKPPEPPSMPNPTRATSRNVAYVAFAAAGAFLGWGFAWWRYAQTKENTAQALSTQFHRAGGDTECRSSGAPDSYCRTVLGAWQSRDGALNLRDGWFAAAGVSFAVGAVATAWTFNLSTMIRGQPQTQVRIRPGGLVLSGTF